MNVFVCVKQVPDTETKIKLAGDSLGIDTAGIKWILSPYDEFAIEEALRVKEKNAGSSVTVISAGPARVVDGLRTALAMGADNAIHVDAPENADAMMISRALAAAIKKKGAVDLVFLGKEAIDDGAAQMTHLMAEHLGLPAVTVVSGIEYGAGSLKVRREVEGGAIEVIEAQMPLVIAAHKGLNEPRYASLPNIMKAKKKEVEVLKLADLGVPDSARRVQLKNFQLPPPKAAGKKIPGDAPAQAKELMRLLREEAKVV